MLTLRREAAHVYKKCLPLFEGETLKEEGNLAGRCGVSPQGG